MKIEVDTQRDSREELMHLANMLKAISGASSGSRDVAVQKQSNIFEDSSPGLGVFNMFGDSSSQQPVPSQYAVSSQQPAPVSQSGGSDVFSLFSSSPAASSGSRLAVESSVPESPEVPRRVSSVRELLEDERIVPY
jgi:hypothetical protein